MVPFHKKQWHHIWVKNWYLREVDGVSDRMLFYLGGKKGKKFCKISILHCPASACKARAGKTIHTEVMKKVSVMGGYYSFYKPVISELSTHTRS